MNIFTTDWLASRPVFYNEKTFKASHRINDIIDWKGDIEFHPEGLQNYLKFGYSVLGQTPLKNIKILPPNSRLQVNRQQLKITTVPDDTPELLSRPPISEEETLDMISDLMANWEKEKEEIILPLSGGYDSRLMCALMPHKEKLRAFSYGASSKHPEAVKAHWICEKLGIDWNYIELENFHDYMDEWDSLFGISTHAHGMYQIEFYRKIKQMGYSDLPLLSGIIGDAWAGSVHITEISSPEALEKLGYTHGMHADHTQVVYKSNNELEQAFFHEKREQLKDPLMRIVEAMRFKIILLNYLMSVPEQSGFQPWSPFLDKEVATRLLTLAPERRKNRIWQKELFDRWKLNAEKAKLQTSRQGSINLKGLRKRPLVPLRTDLLREIIKPQYVEWINRTLSQQSMVSHLMDTCMHTPYLKEILKRSGLKYRRMEAYTAYLTLKPLENIIIKRNNS